MEEIIFDSRNEIDKFPFGAVSVGTDINVGLRTAYALAADSVKLVVINDLNGDIREIELEKVWTELGYDRFEGKITLENAGLYWYYFKADFKGNTRVIEKQNNGAGFTDNVPRSWQITVYNHDYTTPEWIMGGAFYHIFVDRFNKSGERAFKSGSIIREDWGGIPNYLPDELGEIRNNDFFGGNLDGIIEKLPYLSELGITCLYLSPIFEAASNHRYDTADYSRIDPSFGDEEGFEKLCAEAKQLGIRVICDGVFNHTGSDSLYFNREGNYGSGGAYNDENSEYFKWYTFTEYPNKYDAWWGIKTLPQIKKDSLSFRSFITGENGILEKWLRLGASGWRLDVADELSEDFLCELRKTVKAVKPDSLIIGEVWEDASNKTAYGARRHYFEGKELDSVMNYPFKNAIISYALNGNAEMLCETVESICENYPKPALDCMMNLLGTHDTERILTVLGGKHYNTRDERANTSLSQEDRQNAKRRLFLASALQFTLPGVPCIYYGDEAGLEGYEDPFNRRCYPWGAEDAELVDWYKQLLYMRKTSPVFAGGEYRTLRADNGVFGYVRIKNGKKASIYINRGQEPVELHLASGERILLEQNCEKNNNSLRVLSEGCVVVESDL